MKASIQKNAIMDTLFEFFYNLVFTVHTPGYLYVMLWLLQYFALLSSAMLYIYYEAKAESLYKFFKFFNIMSDLNTDDYYQGFSYGLFVIVQIAMLIASYLIYLIRKNGQILELKKSSKMQSLLLYEFLQIFGVASNTVLLQVNTDLLGFTIRELFYEKHFSNYKGILLIIKRPVSSHYALLVLLSISFLELTAINILNILLCQDRSLLQKLFWSPNVAYTDFLMMFIQIFTRSIFILIQINDYSAVFLKTNILIDRQHNIVGNIFIFMDC